MEQLLQVQHIIMSFTKTGLAISHHLILLVVVLEEGSRNAAFGIAIPRVISITELAVFLEANGVDFGGFSEFKVEREDKVLLVSNVQGGRKLKRTPHVALKLDAGSIDDGHVVTDGGIILALIIADLVVVNGNS